MTLRFKFFEDYNLNNLESNLNNFAKDNKDQITKDTIIKVYLNRVFKKNTRMEHDEDIHSDVEVEDLELSNSVMLVWDEDYHNPMTRMINSVEDYEQKVKEPIPAAPLQDSDIEDPSQESNNHRLMTVAVIDCIIKYQNIRDVGEIFDIIRNIDPAISAPWLRYMIKEKLDALVK